MPHLVFIISVACFTWYHWLLHVSHSTTDITLLVQHWLAVACFTLYHWYCCRTLKRRYS